MNATPTNSELAREYCAAQAGKLRAALTRLLAHPDAEAVHDVRVACRRLRVVLRVSRRLFGRRQVTPVRERLKELLTLLGGPRDTEVLAARAQRLAESGDGGAVELVNALQAQTETQRRGAAAAVAQGGFAALPQQVEALAAQPAADSKRAHKRQQARAAERAQRVLARQLKTLRRFRRLHAGSGAARLHALRIEMKKLRYTAEFFTRAFPAAPPRSTAPAQRLKTIIRTAEGYQELLGELHDAVVAQETLAQRLREWRPEAAPETQRQAGSQPGMGAVFSLRALLETARTEEARLRDDFGRRWPANVLRRLRAGIRALREEDEQPPAEESPAHA